MRHSCSLVAQQLSLRESVCALGLCNVVHYYMLCAWMINTYDGILIPSLTPSRRDVLHPDCTEPPPGPIMHHTDVSDVRKHYTSVGMQNEMASIPISPTNRSHTSPTAWHTRLLYGFAGAKVRF